MAAAPVPNSAFIHVSNLSPDTTAEQLTKYISDEINTPELNINNLRTQKLDTGAVLYVVSSAHIPTSDLCH